MLLARRLRARRGGDELATALIADRMPPILVACLLVVVADGIGRSLLAPVEIPVGVVTALIGAPYLVWLLRRTDRG